MLYPVQKIEQSRYNGLVLNIEVEDDNSYVLENAIVHNCEPSAGADIVFDRDLIDEMEKKEPIRISAGFKIFHKYNPSHRYGSGHDVSGGIGLDSSTSVHINFSTYPAKVVGTFRSNTIKPEVFGDEIKREQDIFPGIAGIERNYGTECILKAKMLEVNLYESTTKGNSRIDGVQATEYGWHTNTLTKSQMINGLIDAVNDGLIELSDEDLIAECRSYTRNDLLDKPADPRLTTRHFDLLMAAAIAWQMKDSTEVVGENKDISINEPSEGYQAYNKEIKKSLW